MQLEIGLFFVCTDIKQKKRKAGLSSKRKRETYTTSFNCIGSSLYSFHGALLSFRLKPHLPGFTPFFSIQDLPVLALPSILVPFFAIPLYYGDCIPKPFASVVIGCHPLDKRRRSFHLAPSFIFNFNCSFCLKINNLLTFLAPFFSKPP